MYGHMKGVENVSPTRRAYETDSDKRDLRLEIRINKKELNIIQTCADKMGVSKAEALLKGIELLSEQLAN